METKREWTPIKEYEDILFDYYNGIARITINRERYRNAFTPTTTGEMSDALRICREEPDINVVVLTGAGDKAFCSGGDQNVKGRGGYIGKDGVPRLSVLDVQKQIRSIPKPVIAAVNGFAIGGGHVLHVVCDLSIASENAIFGQTGPRVGSFDAGFGSSYLARVVGQKKAREIWFLCRKYNAQEALDMGLVNKVVPLDKLEDEYVQWAEEMMQLSPLALRMIKAGLNAELDGQAGIQELAGDATLLYYLTDEAQEGKNAFLEKRKPDFKQYPKFPYADRGLLDGRPFLYIIFMYTINIIPRVLHFKQPAGTSRGSYTTRNVWYIHLSSIECPGRVGVGECAPLPKLSCDDLPDYEQVLRSACQRLEQTGELDIESLRGYPSILFGLETALRHYETQSWALWDTPFSRGEAGIPINGLIWMGSFDRMLQQIEVKMQAGYRCIKLKIGAINFEEELALLRHIRAHYSAREIELRVDANGAFSPADAMDKLNRLAELDLHSIEQPIRAGQWEEMARLAAESPLPIALDEELIGCNAIERKRELLVAIHPRYIILKPSLHGGISGGNEWIAEAEKQHIGWWITSALESNIGLNAIAQWCATFRNPLPQGLGTGLLFTDNVEMPLEIRKDCLWFCK